MNFGKFTLSFLTSTILLFIGESNAAICSKFNIGGPCAIISPTTTTTTTTVAPNGGIDSAYCLLACTQGNDNAFSSLCNCATTTTTTSTTSTTTTTTPRPESCYYTRARPAKLAAIGKRLYSATPIVKECEYPGVVGIYNATNQKLQCMGVLLEENTVLVDSLCYKLVNSTRCVAAVQNYQKPTDFTNLPALMPSTAKMLDPTGGDNRTYTISLDKAFAFNDACIQPACVPNANLPLSDVNLDDCRFVGYGDTLDTLGTTSATLLEVKVKVLGSSVASGSLKYERVDGKSARTGPCFSDQGAPLICSHSVTGEWVTIGLVTAVGFKCSSASFTAVTTASLLKESNNHNLYDGLQKFKYIPV